MRRNSDAFDTLRRIFLLSFALSIPLSKTISIGIATFVGFFVFKEIIKGSFLFQMFRKDLVFWALLLFVFVFWLGLFWTEEFGAGLKVCRRVSWGLVAYVLCRGALKGSGEGFWAVGAFVVGVGVLDLLTLCRFLGMGQASAFELPSAVFMNPIWFGSLSALGAYGAFVLLLGGSGNRPFWAFFLGLGVLGVILSNSRGPLLACIGGFFSAFILRLKGGVIKTVVPLLLGVLLLSIWAIPAVHQKFSVVLEEARGFLEEGRVDTSIGARLGMWRMCLEMFERSPFWGIGTGDYELEMKRLVPQHWQGILEYNQPHSIYLYSLALHGVLGLGALCALFLVAFRESIKRAREGDLLALFAFMVLVHYLVAGLTETLFKIHVLVVAFGFNLGVSLAHSKDGKSP